jgi:hypothetical protein
MTALHIIRDKVANFNQLDFSDKREICSQVGTDGTAIKLVLGRRMHKGKHSIFLNGITYKDGVLIKNSILGNYPPTANGASILLSACDCYDYSGMYELISH